MVDYQVPRHAFAWLLLAQAFLLFPHLWRFPVILVPVWVLCSLWRVMIYQGRWSYPSALVKAVLVVFSFVAIGLVQRRWLMVETAILTLLIAFLLKLLEMRQKRDVLVSIYLAYFVLATELLLSQSVLAGLYLVAGLLFVTAALIALQSINNETAWSHPLLQSAKMLVLSVPLMLVAFLVFPRLEPLWKVPMPAGAGKTGISGSMTPGAIAELAQSDALAFRVAFEGEVPALQYLYWRGVVLTSFDGTTWLPDLHDSPVNRDALAISPDSLPPYRYRITMEPSHQSWLFVLAGVVETDALANYYGDFSLQAVDVVSQRESWSFVSYRDAVLEPDISPRHRQAALQLPSGYNPQTLAFARQLLVQSTSPDDYLHKVLAHFRQQEFYYTLTPPLSSGHTVDDFLFNTRRGFCEHYASAFVVLMRAAGIPARVIAGYQGGDINPYEDNVTVRQLDAHAWAEVWLSGKGWLRVDPTYAVAPERIEKGSQESLQDEEQYLAKAPFSPIRYRNLSWLLSMQYRYDQLNFLWHSWVLDYSGERRESVLLAMLGNTSPRTLALFVAAMFAIFGLLFAGGVLLRYRPPAYAPAERIYRRMLKKMARQGLQKMPAEGALDFGRRAAQRWPQSAPAIDQLTRQYLYLNYAKTTDAGEVSRLLKQFRRDVIALQLR